MIEQSAHICSLQDIRMHRNRHPFITRTNYQIYEFDIIFQLSRVAHACNRPRGLGSRTPVCRPGRHRHGTAGAHSATGIPAHGTGQQQAADDVARAHTQGRISEKRSFRGLPARHRLQRRLSLQPARTVDFRQRPAAARSRVSTSPRRATSSTWSRTPSPANPSRGPMASTYPQRWPSYPRNR